MHPAFTFLLFMVLSTPIAAAQPERGPVPRELTTDAIIASLVDALADSDVEVRSHLGAAVANYGPPAVAPLVKALRDANKERRAGAAYAISQMRPAPAEALPALLQALKDPEEIVRRQAAYAISRVTRPQPAPIPTEPDRPIPSPDPTPGSPR